ncbi:hypothetical protein PoB_003411200 [Plakobranchus ocellatus]|uniref:Uncharacterized protein n=1 Tax=Plakobranchus ocellatus TaxID=259542 RepID=A0AAV4AKR8_9GAST|nr:hypothetical protein PoB_003411200 [Plakobranchus ocellatus]
MDGNMAVIRVMPRCPVEAPAKSHLVAIPAASTDSYLMETAPQSSCNSNHEQKLKGHHHTSHNGLFQGHQNFLKMTSDDI